MSHASVIVGTIGLYSSMVCWLTIHSSRRRFAARLNSGVRPYVREMTDYSKPIERFRRAATAYFRLIESDRYADRRGYLRSLFEVLSELGHLALLLPSVEPNTPDEQATAVGYEQWQQLFGTLRQRLGDADAYWMVFDPCDADEHESIMNSLADDLADVYRDLKNSVPDNESVSLTNDQLWDLRFSFETHWGQHAFDALKALYALLYGPHSTVE